MKLIRTLLTALALICVASSGHAQLVGSRATLLSPTHLPAAIDADAQLWATQVVTNGGTVSTTRLLRNSILLRCLKDAGAWATYDDLELLIAENAIQALTSIKQRRLATAVASPIFQGDRGYTFDGATNYIDTLFVPVTHMAIGTPSNIRLSVYLRTNNSTNGYAMGEGQSLNRNIRIRPRAGTGTVVGANAGDATFTPPAAADSRGLSSGSRNGPDTTSIASYRNGWALVRSIDATTFGTAFATVSISIGAQSGASFGPGTIGLSTIGASMTAAQELDSYLCYQRHFIVLGAAT